MGKNGFGFDKDVDRDALFDAYEQMGQNNSDDFVVPGKQKKSKKAKRVKEKEPKPKREKKEMPKSHRAEGGASFSDDDDGSYDYLKPLNTGEKSKISFSDDNSVEQTDGKKRFAQYQLDMYAPPEPEPESEPEPIPMPAEETENDFLKGMDSELEPIAVPEPAQTDEPEPQQEIQQGQVYNSEYEYDPSAPIIIRSRDEKAGARKRAANPKRVSVRKRSGKPQPENAFVPEEENGSSLLAGEVADETPVAETESEPPVPEYKPAHVSGFSSIDGDEYEERTEHRTRQKTSAPKKQMARKSSKDYEQINEMVTKIFALLAVIVCIGGLIFFVYSASSGKKESSKSAASGSFWDGASFAESTAVTEFKPTKDTEIPVIVNADNQLDAKYTPPLVTLKTIPYRSGMKIEKETAGALSEMISALKSAGAGDGLKILNSYKSFSSMKSAFNYAVAENKYVGMTQAAAEAAASKALPRPGYSEFQLGTCVDFTTDGTLQAYFDTTTAGMWLSENCEKYGFVLRYPKEKAAQTGHEYLPYRYRYVGKDAALYMKQNNMCIEEYAAYIKSL